MNQLGVFAKYWEPGAVKTRLARTVGVEAASELYRLFLETTLRRFDGVAEQRRLVYSPAGRAAEFARISGPCWELVAQRGEDLGARMSNYFADTFRPPPAANVLIGSDSPNLPVDYVEKAFHLLTEKAVVLGPSEDGGYYLLGIRGRAPDIFRGVKWSTSDVFRQTVSLLAAERVPFAELPSWYDVDESRGLQQLAAELPATAPGADPVLDRLRAAVAKAALR